MQARSLEDPSYPFDLALAEIFEDAVGNNSGVPIGRMTALEYAPSLRAVSMIARDCAKLPIHVYPPDSSEARKDHPLDFIMNRRAASDSPPVLSIDLRTAQYAAALLTGNGIARIIRDGGFRPVGLRMPRSGESITYDDELAKYIYTTRNGHRELFPFEVFHLRGLTLDGLTGVAAQKMWGETVGMGVAARNFGARYFAQGAAPGFWVESGEQLGSPKMYDWYRNEIIKQWQGWRRAHIPGVLEKGQKIHPLTTDPDRSQLVELREHQVRDTAAAFGVPPHRLGDPSRTSLASLEAENQTYLDSALDPWLVAWEREAESKLLTEEELRAGWTIEHDRTALVRADLPARTAAYREGLAGQAYLTVNDVRRREKLDPVEGGDELMKPLNMSAGTGPAGEQTPAPRGESNGNSTK